MKTLILFLSIVIFFSCNASSDKYEMSDSKVAQVNNEEEMSATAADAEKSYAEPPAQVDEIKIAEKIIKNANIGVEVSDYKKDIIKIKEIIKNNQAFVTNEEENNYSYQIGNVMVIRVKNENFDKLIAALTANVKKVERKIITADDVSEEFVDIQARLKTKKEVEARYSELLKQAKNMGEILLIEEKIRAIREEIEAKEGRLKFLNDRVNYSTITLEVKQIFSYDVYEPNFFDKIGDALSTGWSGLLIIFIGIIYLWPLWLIAGLTLYIIFYFIRKKKKNKQ